MESPSPTQPTNPPVLQTILNKPYEEIKAFSEWLKRNTSNYLIGEHPPAKSKGIHCHILIEGLKVSREALRKQVIKYSPGQGQNATMSETQDTKVKYETAPLAIYIIKGHEEYCKSTSFDNTQIVTWTTQWQNRNDKKTTVLITQVAPKKKPSTKFEDCHEILDMYFMNKTISVDSGKDRQEIVTAIISWAQHKHKAMNSYLVADYYDIILSQAVPEYYSTLCVNIINNRHRFSHT